MSDSKSSNFKRELEKIIASFAGISLISEEASEEEKKVYEQKLMHNLSRKLLGLAIILWLVFITAFWLGRKTAANHLSHSQTSQPASESGRKIKFWTCAMHPNIKMPNNDSKCPQCFMDLVAVFEGGVDDGPRSISLSESAVKLAEIKTQPVVYRRLTHTVRMVGKVYYDETKVANISLWTPGQSRLNQMLVAFTGALVQKGEPLVEVYSPDLIAAQGEYLSAYRAAEELRKSSQNKSMRLAHEDNLVASKRKLLDLGMTEQQIQQLEKRNFPEETTVIYSPVSGTVIDKLVNEGEWHSRGMSIYRIADLSQLWVKLDAYESDMTWIRYAQEVEFDTEAFPGEIFKGRIAFIDPFLNDQTRTIKLRVNVPNRTGRLKPGMFVRAKIHIRVAEGGRVVDETLAGKWVCPIHPEVIREKPGICDSYVGINTDTQCKRQLIPAAKLSFTKDQSTRSRVLAIPHTAPLLTGKRAIVYVEEQIKEYDNEGNAKIVKLQYHGTDVKLGPRAGDYYIVLSGLEEGQQVVIQGAYKIDSALQILAKPSMMNPEVEPQKDLIKQQPKNIPISWDKKAPYHPHFKKLLTAYFQIGEIMAKDHVKGVIEQKNIMQQVLQKLDLSTLPENQREEMARQIDFLQQILHEMHGDDIKQLRRDYLDISNMLIRYLRNFGHVFDNPLYVVHCSMYRHDMGGSWIQTYKKVNNPYYGSEMLRCGDVESVIPSINSIKKGE